MPTLPGPYQSIQFAQPPVPSQSFVFSEGAPRDANRFGDWGEMMEAIGFLPASDQPLITFDRPCTVPLGSWDMRGATLRNAQFTTGQPGSLVLPDGAVLRNLRALDGAMSLEVQATTSPGALIWDAWTPADPPPALFVGIGSVIQVTGTQPAIVSPGAGVGIVLVSFVASWGAAPAPTAPLLSLGVGDSAICSVPLDADPIFDLPAGWIVGGAGGTLTYVAGVDFAAPAIPGYLGAVTILQNPVTAPSAYTPGAPADWIAPPPATVASALDRIAAALAGVLASPIP